jgi:hypothetical protein
MTPKEKARELLKTFDNIPRYAKKAVDEMIEEIRKWAGGEFQEWEKERWKYLQEVKQEIELL